MHSVALDTHGLCSNVSGQLLGSLSSFCTQKLSLHWLLQQLTWCVFPVEVLCQLCSKILIGGDSLNGLVVEGVAGWDPVPFLVTVSL